MTTELVFQVYIHAYTPVGEFTGFASADYPTFEEADEERNTIQELLRSCDSFTFFSDREPGIDITLSSTVIDTSVFKLSISHCPAKTD
jgi:hypothetical protein